MKNISFITNNARTIAGKGKMIAYYGPLCLDPTFDYRVHMEGLNLGLSIEVIKKNL